MRNVWFFILAMTTLLMAQDKTLTLDECVQIALENNANLKMASTDVDIAGTQVTASRSGYLPRVNMYLNGGYYIQGARNVRQDVPVGIDSETGAWIYEEQQIRQTQVQRDNYGAGVSLQQTIWDFGRTSNRVHQSKAYKDYYQHLLTNEENMVVADVKEAYFQLLKSYELLDVYSQALEASRDNLDYYQSMLDIGLTSKAEIYQAKVNVGTQKTSYIRQQNEVEFAKARLNRRLGWDTNRKVHVEREDSSPLFPDYEFSKAVEIALQENERLKALDQEVKAQEYAIRAAKARYLPTIGADVSYSRNNNDPARVYSGRLDEDFTATIGAQINLNLFNGLADKAEIERQILTHERQLENLKEQRRILIANLKEYFLALEAYRDIININAENLKAYQENLRLQIEKRRVGSGTELEVTQAQVEVVRAQEALVGAQYDAKIARAYLEAVLGIIQKH